MMEHMRAVIPWFLVACVLAITAMFVMRDCRRTSETEPALFSSY